MEGLNRAIASLRETPRRQWWVTFLLVSTLCGLWSLASPLFSGPDEPSHVVHAAAIARGQWTGEETERPDVRRGYLVVQVPQIYADPRIACFAYHPGRPAGCQTFEGSSNDGEAVTSAARHPPAYYAAAGLLSRLYKPGAVSVYLMRLVGVLVTGGFVATAVISTRRLADPRLAAAGLLVAMTPMVLFVAGVVNPSGPEIAAAIAVWVCGAVLVGEARQRIDRRLVTQVGIAACVVALSRQLGPLWLGLIALALVALAGREAIGRLARDRLARVWAAAIAACAAFQVGWVVLAGTSESNILRGKRLDETASMIRRLAIGKGYSNFLQMLGVFGWLDTPAPALTWVLLIAAVSGLVILALTLGRRRVVLVMLAVAALTVLIPMVLEVRVARDVGLFWQGRYMLPFAVGVPILAALALVGSAHRRVLERSWLLPALGIAVVVAHVAAFAQSLRRYTVGYDARLQYWDAPHWLAPIPILTLTIGFALTIAAFATWLLAVGSSERRIAKLRHRR